MSYDDFENYGGTDGSSTRQSSSTVPSPIKNALKPKRQMSVGQANNALGNERNEFGNKPADAVDDPIFANYDWSSPYAEPVANQSAPGAQRTNSESLKSTASDNGVAPSASDVSSGVGNLPASVKNDTPTMPTLADQGPRNPFLRAISRITGMTGPQPAPGQPYTGPTDTTGKMGALGNWLGRLGNRCTENFGTPFDRELAMKRMQLGNEAAWRAAMIGVKSEANDINQQKADTAQSKMLGDMRRYGYTLNDPNDPNGGFRSMTEPEILADPELGLKFNSQMSKMGLTDAQTDRVRDMLMGRFTVDPWIAAVTGSPEMSNAKVSAQQFQNIGKVLSAKGIQIKDLGTEGMWALDRIGNKLHQVSAVGPSVARAQMYAMLRPVQAITPEGDLSWMTAGQAIQQGAAPAGAGASALSKQAQMQDIKVASQNMRQAINSLENPLTPQTIAQLTMASRSTDPSVFATEVDSLLGSQRLSPDQQNFLVWMAQLHERAMSLRNIAGMGAASDKLRDAIISTLPSAKSADRGLMTRQLDGFDNMVSNLERGIPIVGRTPIHHAAQSNGQHSGSTVDDLVKKYGR